MTEGGRPTRASGASNGLVVATIALLVVLILIGAGLTAAAGSIGEIPETTRLFIGLLLTIVPALLWLGLFYAQDRLEPEPHHYVVGLLILGALLGGAIEQPLLRDIFQVHLW